MNRLKEMNTQGIDDEAIPASKPSNNRGGQGSPGRSNAPGGFGSRANVQQPVNPDSIVIPTHKNKNGGNQMGMGGIDEDPFGNKIEDNSVNINNAEEIRVQDAPVADMLKPQLSEPIVRAIFSRSHQYREKAATELQREVMKGAKSDMYSLLHPG